MNKQELIERIKKIKDADLLTDKVKAFISGYLFSENDNRNITWDELLEIANYAGINKEDFAAPSEIFEFGVQDDTKGFPTSF